MSIRNQDTVSMGRCPVCGESSLEAREVREQFEYGEGNEKVSVVAERVPIQVCGHCGEHFSGAAAAAIYHEAIRRALHLLTGEEIRQLRESLGLSQTNFALLLGVGVASVSRWERGRLLQNRGNDNLMRLMRDHPEVTVSLRSYQVAAAIR